MGDRLSPVPAAIADEIVGGRCTHRPPAGALFQIADTPPLPTAAHHAILTSLTHPSRRPAP